MAKIDKTYHDLLKKILNEGFKYEDPNRKNVYRYQIPHFQIKHNFSDGFPAITTKKLYWKGVVAELIWFLRGDTNIKYLVDNGVNIWNKDAYNFYKKKFYSPDINTMKDFFDQIKKDRFNQAGNLGRVYGAQWRNFMGYADDVDQISNLIKGLKENPMGTRHIVTAWNPAELDDMALPPCHWSFEILVEPLSILEQSKLHTGLDSLFQNKVSGETWETFVNNYNIPKHQFTLKWHQRSVDTFLGLPFNIASYALLAHIIGKLTGMIPKGIISDLSNVHIYEPHIDAVKEQLSKDINKYDKCELRFAGEESNQGLEKGNIGIFNHLEVRNFRLRDYESYPAIPAEMLAYDK